MYLVSRNKAIAPISILPIIGNYERTRDRTWNLLLRRQAPYPLGHTSLYSFFVFKILKVHELLAKYDVAVTVTKIVIDV